ncbi:MAG: sarcosine oxidase subunit gamma [Gammaproteobacteria bacterium]
MSEHSERKSPLYRLLEPAVRDLQERAFEGQLLLRGDGAGAFVSAVEAGCGIAPPLEPNTVATAGTRRMAWLGPSEWLLTVPAGEEAALRAALEAALAGQHAAVVDVTDGNTVIVLEGEDATEILCGECPLDLHPRAFPVGRCAQTLLGKSNVMIVREAPDRFALLVRRSFAPYVWTLLRHLAGQVRAAQSAMISRA